MPDGRPISARPLALAAALVALVAVAGCEGAPPPKDTRVTGVSSSAPEPFQAMRSLLVKLGRLRDDGDAAGARALFSDVITESRHLLTMPPPNDLKRENVARFLDGRAAFTESLNALARAVAGSDDASLWSASREFDATFWAWFDAYRGKPTEGPV